MRQPRGQALGHIRDARESEGLRLVRGRIPKGTGPFACVLGKKQEAQCATREPGSVPSAWPPVPW